MPITQSLLVDSFICTLVMLRLRTLVERYSTLHVRLLRKVMSIPSNGEKDSLMLTALTLYMLPGTGLPVVASLIKPRPFMYSTNVL